MHQLDFYIPTELNPRAFKISDNSVYDDNIPVTNNIIEVTPPGFSYAMIFRVNKDFDLTLNSNLLHLNSHGFKSVPTMMDGLYKIKYSVNPNSEVNIEYYYFRNILQQMRYHNSLYNFIKNKFNLKGGDYKKIQSEYIWVKELMDNAKYAVEDELNISLATEMYKEVDSIILNINKLCI